MSVAGERWYRLPVVWLGALILVASIAGCAVFILLATRHPDPPLTVEGEQVLKVPLGPAAAGAAEPAVPP